MVGRRDEGVVRSPHTTPHCSPLILTTPLLLISPSPCHPPHPSTPPPFCLHHLPLLLTTPTQLTIPTHHPLTTPPSLHQSPLPLTTSPHPSSTPLFKELKGPNQTKRFVNINFPMSINLCRTFLSLTTSFLVIF